MQALHDTEARYRLVAQRAGLTFEPGEFVVVERVLGDATSAWGVPSLSVPADTRQSTINL